jgi:hypothetical protein
MISKIVVNIKNKNKKMSIRLPLCLQIFVLSTFIFFFSVITTTWKFD